MPTSENAWEDVCRDCRRKKPPTSLRRIVDFRLMHPPVNGIYLCRACVHERELDIGLNRPIRPVGVPPHQADKSEWIDIDPVIVAPVNLPEGGDVNKPEIPVKIKILVPKIPKPTYEDGGIVLMQIGDNQYWERVAHLVCKGFSIELMKKLAVTAVRFNLNRLFAKCGMKVKEG